MQNYISNVGDNTHYKMLEKRHSRKNILQKLLPVTGVMSSTSYLKKDMQT
jgi:hypothetical protein